MVRRLFPALVLPLLLGAGGPAFAQTMYRCGNTFSQTPCGSDPKAVAVPAAARASAPAASRAQPCLAELAARVGLDDPKALRVGRVDGPKVQAIDFKGDKLVVRTYDVTVSLRNAHGGYSGTAVYTCHLSEDEQRVVGFQEPRKP